MLMAANCVRGASIEYPADGKSAGLQLTAFNRKVVNKLYTFLTLYFGQTDESLKLAFLSGMEQNYPKGWDLPKLDAAFVTAAKRALKAGSRMKFAN